MTAGGSDGSDQLSAAALDTLPDSQLLTNREIPTAAPPHRREDSAIST